MCHHVPQKSEAVNQVGQREAAPCPVGADPVISAPDSVPFSRSRLTTTQAATASGGYGTRGC